MAKNRFQELETRELSEILSAIEVLEDYNIYQGASTVKEIVTELNSREDKDIWR